MNNRPTTEERIWAVVSHLSAITFGMGILLPVIGWSEQRRKSNYASFQCLQALGYQSLGYTIWLLTYLVVMIILLIILVAVFGSIGESGRRVDAIVGIGMSVFFIVVIGFFGVYLLFPVIAVVSCALGRDYRYPVMGDRLARYLGFDPAKASGEPVWLIEDHEDGWVAAMGHFSVIIALWGMLAPLTAWILQGERNPFLKFQSLQTVVYQAGVNLFSLGGGFIYLNGFFVFFSLAGLGDSPVLDSSRDMIGILALGISLLVTFGIFLVLPLLHILGQWAGYRVLKGENFHYPLVGRLVERWFVKQVNSNTEENIA